jgi:hypothetical protein
MRIVLLLAIVLSVVTPPEAQFRLRQRPPAASSSPITANEHPRLGFCLNSYGGACQTRAALLNKINASTTGFSFRLRAQENIAFIDSKWASIIKLSGCTQANPTVCTSADENHGINTNDTVYLWTNGTPNLTNTTSGHVATKISDTTFSVPVTVTVAATEGWVGVPAGGFAAPPADEVAMMMTFYAQMLTAGSITGASPAHSAAGYGEKGVGGKLVLMGMRTPPGYRNETYFYNWEDHVTYDWGFPWATTTAKSTMATFIKDQVATDYWTGGVVWNNGTIPTLGYVLVGAAAMAGDGFQDAWATSTLALFASKVCCDDTSYVRSWSAFGNFEEASIIEGTNYYAYAIVAAMMHPELYRTAQAIPKATFYNAASYAHSINAVKYYVYSTEPWGAAQTGHVDNIQRCLTRSHYAYTWREGTCPSEVLRISPMLSAGIVGFVDTTLQGVGIWYQEHRTIYNSEPGYGGNNINGGYAWINAMVAVDPTVAAITPAAAGFSNIWHGGGNYHVYREHLTNDNTYLLWYYTPKYTTGTARGREASHPTDHFTVSRKGPQIIIRGDNSHTGGTVGNRNTQCAVRADRTRRDTYGKAGGDPVPLDDMGCPRNAEGVPVVLDSSDFTLTGATYRDDVQVADEDVANGRTVSFVYSDVTSAYATSATATTINPASVSKKVTRMFIWRGASEGDPLSIVRQDFMTLTSGTTYRRVFNLNTAGEPTYNASGTVAGPSLPNGDNAASTTCHTTQTDASIITAINVGGVGSNYAYNGKTVATILWPIAANRAVYKAGGPNQSGKKWFCDDGNPVGDCHAGHVDNSCENVDWSGLRHSTVNEISKLGGGATSGNVTGPGPGQNLDYTAYASDDTGYYHSEIWDTSTTASGDHVLCYEIGDSTLSPKPCSVGTSLTNVRVAIHGPQISVFSEDGDEGLTSSQWTMALTNSTTYMMGIASHTGSRTVSCTNVTSFTQLDPTDTSSPYDFSVEKLTFFSFTTTSTSVVCTVS